MTDTYHEDHGEGADFYSAGRSRGCGGSGIWRDGRSVGVAQLPRRAACWPRARSASCSSWTTSRSTRAVPRWPRPSASRWTPAATCTGSRAGTAPGAGRARGSRRSRGPPASRSIRRRPRASRRRRARCGRWEPIDKNGNMGCAIVVDPARLLENVEADGNYLAVGRIATGAAGGLLRRLRLGPQRRLRGHGRLGPLRGGLRARGVALAARGGGPGASEGDGNADATPGRSRPLPADDGSRAAPGVPGRGPVRARRGAAAALGGGAHDHRLGRARCAAPLAAQPARDQGGVLRRAPRAGHRQPGRRRARCTVDGASHSLAHRDILYVGRGAAGDHVRERPVGGAGVLLLREPSRPRGASHDARDPRPRRRRSPSATRRTRASACCAATSTRRAYAAASW